MWTMWHKINLLLWLAILAMTFGPTPHVQYLKWTATLGFLFAACWHHANTRGLFKSKSRPDGAELLAK